MLMPFALIFIAKFFLKYTGALYSLPSVCQNPRQSEPVAQVTNPALLHTTAMNLAPTLDSTFFAEHALRQENRERQQSLAQLHARVTEGIQSPVAGPLDEGFFLGLHNRINQVTRPGS
jgi:hypothetical protein